MRVRRRSMSAVDTATEKLIEPSGGSLAGEGTPLGAILGSIAYPSCSSPNFSVQMKCDWLLCFLTVRPSSNP